MRSVLLYLLKSPTILSVIHDLADRWLFFGINLDPSGPARIATCRSLSLETLACSLSSWDLIRS